MGGAMWSERSEGGKGEMLRPSPSLTSCATGEDGGFASHLHTPSSYANKRLLGSLCGGRRHGQDEEQEPGAGAVRRATAP